MLTTVLALCDPTSIPKLPRFIPALIHSLPKDRTTPRPLTHLSPNMIELDLFHSLLYSPTTSDEVGEIAWEYINALNLTADWRNQVESFTNRPDRGWIRNEGVLPKMVACLPFVGSFWVKASHRGILHLRITRSPPPRGDSLSRYLSGEIGSLVLTHHPAIRIPEDELVSTTGAGDTFVGGVVAGLIDGRDEADIVGRALERVGRTMRSRRAVG